MAQEPSPVSILALSFPSLWIGNAVLIVDSQTQEQNPEFWLHCARGNGFEGPQHDSVLIQNTA